MLITPPTGSCKATPVRLSACPSSTACFPRLASFFLPSSSLSHSITLSLVPKLPSTPPPLYIAGHFHLQYLLELLTPPYQILSSTFLSSTICPDHYICSPQPNPHISTSSTLPHSTSHHISNGSSSFQFFARSPRALSAALYHPIHPSGLAHHRRPVCTTRQCLGQGFPVCQPHSG